MFLQVFINIIKGGMYTEKLNILDLNFLEKPYDGVKYYAQTKRQQVILTEIWAKKYTDIKFYSMHPGW
jgi:dehydrogenase/reductase SDR family protein 12